MLPLRSLQGFCPTGLPAPLRHRTQYSEGAGGKIRVVLCCCSFVLVEETREDSQLYSNSLSLFEPLEHKIFIIF